MKKILKYPLTIFFTLFIFGFFIANMLTPERKFSEMENKYLATFPKFSLQSLFENKWTMDYEEYVNDQFLFRDEWIGLKSRSEFALGKTENNGVVYGTDGYMFGRYQALDPQFHQNVTYLKEFAEKYPDLPITVSIVPNAYAVLTDKLPIGFYNVDQKMARDQAYGQLNLENVTTLDMTDALKAHDDEYIYYRTDHHWTTLGAYYGYENFVEKLGMTPVPLTDLKGEQVTGFLGTHYSKAKLFNVIPDEINYYDIPDVSIEVNGQAKDNLYDLSKFSVRDKYAGFLWGNNGITVMKSENNQNKAGGETSRILVIKDSYANSFVPYLTYNYDEIVMVDMRYLTTRMHQLLAENEFDQVLFLYNFETFASDTNFAMIRY